MKADFSSSAAQGTVIAKGIDRLLPNCLELFSSQVLGARLDLRT